MCAHLVHIKDSKWVRILNEIITLLGALTNMDSLKSSDLQGDLPGLVNGPWIILKFGRRAEHHKTRKDGLDFDSLTFKIDIQKKIQMFHTKVLIHTLQNIILSWNFD